MANKPEEEEQERKIPVFTVQKNGAILKNIFVVNKPPSPPSVVQNEDQEEEILIVGRHPDCTIMLTHPSISRFHLQINSNPSSHKLSVTDLSSVHGTWVSGKKLDPGCRVELIEGDSIRVGGSTRVYILHWLPLSSAYDMDNPFLLASDMTMTEDKEEENALLEDDNAVEAYQGENSLSIQSEGVVEEDLSVKQGKDSCQDENALSIEFKHIEEKVSVEVEGKEEEKCQEMNSLPIESEHIVEEDSSTEGENVKKIQDESSLSIESKFMGAKDTLIGHKKEKETFQDDNSLSVEKKEIQLLDLMLEGIDSLFSDDYSGLIVKKEIPSSPPMLENMETIICNEKEEDEQSRNDHEVREALSEIENLQVCNDYETAQPLFAQPLSDRGGQEDSTADRNLSLLVNLNSSSSDEEGNCPAAEIFEEAENQSLLGKDYLLKEISTLSSVPLPTEPANSVCEEDEQSRNDHEVRKIQSVREALSEIEKLQVSNENETPQPPFALQPLCERGDQENSTTDRNLNLLVNLNSSCSDEESNRPAAEVLEEAENQSLLREDYLLREISSLSSVPLPTESVNSSNPVGKVLEIKDYKESQTTPQSLFVAAIENLESCPERSEKRSTMDSIWSRRGKPATAIQIQTDRSRGKTTGANTDAGVEQKNLENIENRSILKVLFSGLEGMEEEIYTPDKENFTPNTLLKSMKKKGKLGEIRHSKSSRSSSSKVTFSPNIQPEEDMIASLDKENQTSKVLQQRKSAKPTSENQVKLEQEMMVMKRRAAERVPFQSLIVNSAGKSRSEASVPTSENQVKLEQEMMVMKRRAAERVPFQSLILNSPGKSLSEASVPNVPTRSSNSVCCTQTMEKRITHSSSNNSVGEGKRSWTMVVDTASLLDKETRKSLQLLQGLKGTQLIIPRMVIRELDCLKRRGSLFRRTTEVSSVLDWIEECMIKTNWWIHVQSSVEEGRPIAPTPPATPQSRFSGGSGVFPCGSTSSVTFSAHRSLMEIATPTAEDHILDCALLFRKMKNDGQLVLLSNDVTLKIKAMAEGLLCETAQEFRESLVVNPFSDRFLWADSSPRGRNWSYLDDVVLREKYNRCPVKKSFKGEGAKGLKLILLHNSQYGQITSAS